MKTLLTKIFVASSLIFSIFSANSQSYVYFNYDYNSPQSITFEGVIQDTIAGFDTTYWHWDFGDNSTFDTVLIDAEGFGEIYSTVSHHYLADTTGYNVCLEVSTNEADPASYCSFISTSPCAGFSVDHSILVDSCGSNAANGGIYLMVSGGTEPYTFLWSNGATTQNIEVFEAGEYCYTVSDADDCETSDCVIIEYPSTVNINYNKKDLSSPVSTDGEIELLASGGKEPYTYLWSTGEGVNFIDELAAGIYYATATDAYNCKSETNIAIFSDYLSFSYDTCLYYGIDTSTCHIEEINTTSTPGILSITWTIPGADSITFIETEHLFEYAGLYSLELMLNCNKSSAAIFDTVEITNDMLLDIGQKKTTALKVFPNPAKGNVSIELEGDNANDCTVEIIDLSGRVVFKKNIQRSTQRIDIAIEELKSGLYLLHVKSENTIYSAKLLKE